MELLNKALESVISILDAREFDENRTYLSLATDAADYERRRQLVEHERTSGALIFPGW